VKSFLLDTNAVSEWAKPQPNPGLIQWLDTVDEDRTFLSAVSVGELRYGVERLPDGTRKSHLARWLCEELPDRFRDRILPIDEVVAQAWGRVRSRTESAGRLISPMDGFLAATAESHGLDLVTRNGKHFAATGLAIVDPWTR
jgi:predicted nucleic acid-binding protein